MSTRHIYIHTYKCEFLHDERLVLSSHFIFFEKAKRQQILSSTTTTLSHMQLAISSSVSYLILFFICGCWQRFCFYCFYALLALLVAFPMPIKSLLAHALNKSKGRSHFSCHCLTISRSSTHQRGTHTHPQHLRAFILAFEYVCVSAHKQLTGWQRCMRERLRQCGKHCVSVPVVRPDVELETTKPDPVAVFRLLLLPLLLPPLANLANAN